MKFCKMKFGIVCLILYLTVSDIHPHDGRTIWSKLQQVAGFRPLPTVHFGDPWGRPMFSSGLLVADDDDDDDDDDGSCNGILWDAIRCAPDADQKMPEGKVPDMGRFPWMGILQHSFYLAEKTRYAVTGAVLIHPGYAIAPAEDVGKIVPENLLNNTQFIMWDEKNTKYAMDVMDYLLHPEYMEKVTVASIALLQLFEMTDSGYTITPAPVLPVCLAVSGAGVFTDLYAVRMTDENQELQKEITRMTYVESGDCEEFYFRANLDFRKMTPTSSVCATSFKEMDPCVWDGGVALITRQSWGFWKLLGFGVRGPGCGAPARFVNVHDYMPWIDEIVSRRPSEEDLDEETHKWVLREISPVQLIMYQASKVRTKETGQCHKDERGDVVYKDNTEITVDKNFAQGFFFITIYGITSFTCMIVNLETTARTNAVMWVEHHCHRDLSGLAPGVTKPLHRGDGYKKLECFMYFKSAAFIEFRFYFSFKAVLEVTLFGIEESPRNIPNPWVTDITTYPWWPTARIIKWGTFVPYYVWWYSL